MLRHLKKHLKILFTGSFTMVLAACYGVDMDMENQVFVQTINNKNVPITGLKVTLYNNGEAIENELTDLNGEVLYPSLYEGNTGNDYVLKIADIDSTENGGMFKEKIINIVDNQLSYTAVMEEDGQ